MKFKNINKINLFPLLFAALFLLSAGGSVSALSVSAPGLTRTDDSTADDIWAERYAAQSQLAEGKWARVKIGRTGMQFVSAATLRNLGFSDPSKVNAYGFGGRIIPENLTPTEPDDLPLLPTLHSTNGIWFFGFDHIRWNPTTSGLSYNHVMQPYAEESWYYLSDKSVVPLSLTSRDAGNTEGLPVLDTFSQMLLHESDIFAPATTGCTYLGEDFRSPTSRSFSFNLVDLADGEAKTRIGFAAKTSGSASITVSANGSRLTASSGDSFAASTSADQYFLYNTTTKKIPSPKQNLELSINFQNSGSVTLARLDFIEVEYPRLLALRDGELYFNTDTSVPEAVTLSGVNAQTVVWDITDPIRPVEIKLDISGTTGRFCSETGRREYVAFNPGSVTNTITTGESISNQNIHALPSPDLLIITPFEYKDEAERLAAHHRDFDALDVEVLTPEEIYNEFSSGTPDPSAFRKLLKMWYQRDNGKIKYCLIMSRPTYDHKALAAATKSAKYPRVPIWQSTGSASKTNSYATDDFIGMLEESSANFAISTAKINVSVGRMPVTSAAEAGVLVDKYINHVTNPEPGEWRNQFMIIADDQDNALHFDQSQNSYNALYAQPKGRNYLYERLYLDTYPLVSGATGHTYPEAKKKMLRLWNNDGVAFINYIGHASTYGWSHEDLLNRTDIEAFTNTKLPFLYAATCEFARYDDDERSGAELLWANPKGGLIATVCPSRTVYMSPNGTLSKAFAAAFFTENNKNADSRRIGDIYRDAKNAVRGSDDNKLRFCLIGNPAMRFQTPAYTVSLDSINHLPIAAAAADYPVLPARSSNLLSGSILNEDGQTDTAFNGVLDIQLYDAEKVIDTFGNGDNGVVKHYNDRRTLLYRGSASVKNGVWSAVVQIPAEIENNFSAARLTFYAQRSERKEKDPTLSEAHGASDKLYVYGYNTEADDDNQGPVISLFALNREDFSNGDVVHTSSILLLKVSDPSGINLSDAGIGHKITLTLDGKKEYDDLNSYFTPDIDDSTSGSLTYPLNDIEPGKHTLRIIVWDNAGNFSTAELEFEVAATLPPQIYDLYTDVNPAREKVNFTLSTDTPLTQVDYMIEVFDLNGASVWKSDAIATTDRNSALSVAWDLSDTNGTRIPRGIYLYRATVIAENGASVTKTKKLAVTAP